MVPRIRKRSSPYEVKVRSALGEQVVIHLQEVTQVRIGYRLDLFELILKMADQNEVRLDIKDALSFFSYNFSIPIGHPILKALRHLRFVDKNDWLLLRENYVTWT